MDKEYLNVKKTPTVLWNQKAEKVFLYVHGTGGNKEEAEFFTKIVAAKGYQVLSIDLPGFGERRSEIDSFVPWKVVPELDNIMAYLQKNYQQISLFANSIGVYFSLMAYQNIHFHKCLFVSPILDMKTHIKNAMDHNGVTVEQLRLEQTIKVNPQKTLSWEYWQYANQHPVSQWNSPTVVLHGEKDDLTSQTVVDKFCQKFHCQFTSIKNGSHYFHTPQQLAILKDWVQENS